MGGYFGVGEWMNGWVSIRRPLVVRGGVCYSSFGHLAAKSHG